MIKMTHHPRLDRPGADGRHGERGVILPLTALSMVTLLLVATLVIDGSQAYPQRRSMQNAADAASLAGARALDKAKWFGGQWTEVARMASSIAAENRAESSICTVIDSDGDPLGPCDSQAVVLSPSAAGVAVEATDVRRTTFGAFAGRDNVTARARAAATVQTFLGGTGAPFAICDDGDPDGYRILKADGTLNTVGLGKFVDIDLQAPTVPDCGARSSPFKGKIEPDQLLTKGAWVEVTPGNGFDADIRTQVLGATPCVVSGQNLVSGCDILLPVVDEAGPGSGTNITLHVAAWIVVHVTPHQGNPKYTGTYVGVRPYVGGGTTSSEPPGDRATPRVIRLIR